jgi:uncharacterized membrane protein YeiH
VIVRFLELLGVAVFAVSGALVAGRKKLDLLGVVIIAAVTAIGGGTIRDLLLDRHPVFWVADPIYLYIILLSAAVTIVYVRRFRPPERLLLVADALGLALFSISGAQIAERAGLQGIAVVLMGTLTGSAGGMIRDVLTAEIPMILRRGQIYATASIAGIIVYLTLQGIGVERTLAGLIGMAAIVGLRLAAIVWEITLPVFTVQDHDE